MYIVVVEVCIQKWRLMLGELGTVTFHSTQAILGSRITNKSPMFHIYHVLIQLLIPVYVTSFITQLHTAHNQLPTSHRNYNPCRHHIGAQVLAPHQVYEPSYIVCILQFEYCILLSDSSSPLGSHSKSLISITPNTFRFPIIPNLVALCLRNQGHL